jgi:hypothetical protein
MKNNSPGGSHVASTSRTLRRLLPREALIGRDKEWLRELNEQRQNAGLLPLQETRRPKAQRNELLWLRQTPGWMSTHSPVWCAGRYNPITAMSGAGEGRKSVRIASLFSLIFLDSTNEFFQIQAYLIHWFRLLALLFPLFSQGFLLCPLAVVELIIIHM